MESNKTFRIICAKGCHEDAVKKCRHGFYSCNKHKHGCKHEEEFILQVQNDG